MHRQEPAQEHQVQVQGERAPALFAVEAGDVPLLIFFRQVRCGWGRASDGEDAEAHSGPMTHLFCRIWSAGGVWAQHISMNRTLLALLSCWVAARSFFRNALALTWTSSVNVSLLSMLNVEMSRVISDCTVVLCCSANCR